MCDGMKLKRAATDGKTGARVRKIVRDVTQSARRTVAASSPSRSLA